jgi:hypothetical protein
MVEHFDFDSIGEQLSLLAKRGQIDAWTGSCSSTGLTKLILIDRTGKIWDLVLRLSACPFDEQKRRNNACRLR